MRPDRVVSVLCRCVVGVSRFLFSSFSAMSIEDDEDLMTLEMGPEEEDAECSWVFIA